MLKGVQNNWLVLVRILSIKFESWSDGECRTMDRWRTFVFVRDVDTR